MHACNRHDVHLIEPNTANAGMLAAWLPCTVLASCASYAGLTPMPRHAQPVHALTERASHWRWRHRMCQESRSDIFALCRAATRDEYVRIEEAVHVELAVLVMDAQNALDYVTRALTLSSRALLDIATHHQQETVKTVRLELLWPFRALHRHAYLHLLWRGMPSVDQRGSQ